MVFLSVVHNAPKNKKKIIAIGGKNFKNKLFLVYLMVHAHKAFLALCFYKESIVNPTALIVATGIKEAATTVSG